MVEHPNEAAPTSAVAPALGKPRMLVLVATGLMTVSQFFHYQGSYNQQTGIAIVGGGGGDHVQADAATGTAIANAYYTIGGISGWTLHPHAWIAIAAVATIFGFALKLGKTWEVWGYWVAVAAMVFCLFPPDIFGAPPGFGFYAGTVAVLLAVWAARLHAASLKTPTMETPPHA